MTPRTLATTLYAAAFCIAFAIIAVCLGGPHVPVGLILLGVAGFVGLFIAALCVDAEAERDL